MLKYYFKTYLTDSYLKLITIEKSSVEHSCLDRVSMSNYVSESILKTPRSILAENETKTLNVPVEWVKLYTSYLISFRVLIVMWGIALSKCRDTAVYIICIFGIELVELT